MEKLEQMCLSFMIEETEENKASMEEYFSKLNDDEKISKLNKIREVLHNFSPFKDEPVDFVKWVSNDGVKANDYNPNKVAPPEMKLLEHSIVSDGYTQPIVTWPHDNKIEVIDGFHRHRVGKESKIVSERIKGYLPVVSINHGRSSSNDRMASTIRHNRARGKHQVDAMSEIILELKNRNWKNVRIAKELGMDEEEILRLCQITGLQDIFSDDDFSKSWVSSDTIGDKFEELTEDIPEGETQEFRTVNTSDPDRVFHHFSKWECQKAGFYASKVEGKTKKECEEEFRSYLSDLNRFEDGLKNIIKKWKHSCEHYLTNKAMNRIAWLGQASVCYSTGIPSKYCSGYNELTVEEQDNANDLALKYLNIWMNENNRDELELDEALSAGRQVNIY